MIRESADMTPVPMAETMVVSNVSNAASDEEVVQRKATSAREALMASAAAIPTTMATTATRDSPRKARMGARRPSLNRSRVSAVRARGMATSVIHPVMDAGEGQKAGA